jgi:hypothetical protein
MYLRFFYHVSGEPHADREREATGGRMDGVGGGDYHSNADKLEALRRLLFLMAHGVDVTNLLPNSKARPFLYPPPRRREVSRPTSSIAKTCRC